MNEICGLPLALSVFQKSLTSTVHAVLAPGKRRGYTQLRFRLRAWETLRAALGNRWSAGLSLTTSPNPATPNESPEFALDVGVPTALDRWAPQIATWRAEGMIWEEIVRRTGLDLNRAFIAWKRYTEAQKGGKSSK